jgi:hypothetical protein
MTKRPKSYLLTHIWTFPAAILSWIAVLIVRVLWGHKLEWLDGLWCELKEDSWPMRTWYKRWGGTTFVRGGFYRPGRKGQPGRIDTRTEAHEHIHIEQAEASALFGTVVAITIILALPWSTAGFITALAVWTLTAPLIYLAAGIQAVVRGESFYKGNHFEEHAYDSDDKELEKHLVDFTEWAEEDKE